MISMNKTYTPELTPEVLNRLRDYAELFQRPLPLQGPACLERCLSPRPAPGRRSQEHRTHGRPRPHARRTARHQGPRTSAATIRQPEPLGRTAPSSALPCRDGPATWPAHRGSSSSTIPASPSRASTPSVCNISTAANWARRPTARSPSRSTTSAPRGTFPPPCGSICPNPGPMPRSGSMRRASRRSSVGDRPRARSRWSCSTRSAPRAVYPARWSSPMRAMGSSQDFREGLEQRRVVLHRGRDLGDGRLHRGAALGSCRPSSGGRPRTPPPSGRRLPAAGEPEVPWPSACPAAR